MKEKLQYMLFGNEQASSGRKIYLDYLRAMATVFVICTHVVGLTEPYFVAGTKEFQIVELLGFVFVAANLIFIMVSGALLLPVKGESAGRFWSKRFLKVAIPLIVYYIIYVCAKEGIQCLYPSYLPTLLIRILSGPPVEAPHFWLIYVILGLYALTPLLRYLVQNIPDSVLSGVIVVIFVVNALDTYLPLFGMDAHLSLIVDSYAGVFVLGYYIASGRCSRRVENILIAGGVISFAVTAYIIFYHGWYDDYIYNNAPTMMLFAAALFLMIKRATAQRTTTGKFIRLISRYSFSILLIHWAVLHVAVKDVLGIDVMSGGVIGGCLLMIVLTLTLSVIGGVVLDNTLIKAIYIVIDKMKER